MNSKKAITLLVLATLIMSLVPVISVNAIGITNTRVWDDGYLTYPGSVTKGTTVVLNGGGATPGRQVKVYWDGLDDLLNTTTAKGDGSYEIWFDVPEAVNGDHWVTVENVYNGEYITSAAIWMDASLKLSPSSGLKNDVITVNGYGFTDDETIMVFEFDGTATTLTPGEPETNDVGSWTATFKVPDLTPEYEYTVYAEDNETVHAQADFKIGASITLNKDSGPSGTVVRVTGRGFTYNAYINGTVTLDDVQCGFVTENAKVKSNGEFTCDIVIPDTGDTGEFDLFVEEWGIGSVNATATFEQTGRPAIELTPTYGPVGSVITVKGYNFTQISGADVVLSLDGDSKKTVETNSAGEFTTTYRIPGASGTPNIVANQTEDYNIMAMEPFRVGFITVVIYPESAVAGEEVTVSGSGFEHTCNVTLDGELWADAVTESSGVINAVNHVPSMEPGVYNVVVTESVTGISVTVELTVEENTYVTLSPTVAPATYGVDIEGYNFAQNPGSEDDLTFILYNETDEWPLDVEYDNVIVHLEDDEDWDAGYFEGNFTLPSEDEISYGTYWLNVTDGVGMFTQTTLEVVAKTVDIEPKKTTFRVGETVGFDVESSFMQPNSYIKVWDPTGNLYWETDIFAEDLWIQVGTIMRVPYYSQVAGGNLMTLLEDAPLGTWSWTWYDEDDDELDAGTFEVAASSDDVLSGQVEDLNNKLTDLASQVEDVSGEFDDVKSSIADVSALAQQAVNAANAATDAVNAVAQTANTASQAAADAADAANAAKDAANGLTTLVYGAIGAALVAALAAIVSLMQISKRIAG